MSLSRRSIVEILEPRRLFSGSLSQAQAQLQTDTAAYSADISTCDALIAKDKAQVNADSLSGREHLASLEIQLAKDRATRTATLATDRSNERIAAAGDSAEILRDKVTIKVDKKNPTALAADEQKLMSDKVQLESDHVKFQTIFLNDNASTQSTILTDDQLIANARATLDNPTLNADEETLLADQKTCLAELAADQIKILNDQLLVTEDTVSA